MVGPTFHNYLADLRATLAATGLAVRSGATLSQ